MDIEKNVEEMIRRSLTKAPLQSFTEPKVVDCYIASKEKDCFTCKYGRGKSDGLGGFAVYCKHPQNTHETNYKYATECQGNSVNRFTHWEPDCDMEDCDMEETNQAVKADAGKPQLTLVPRQIIYTSSQLEKYDQEAKSLMKPEMICKTQKRKKHWYALFRCQYCGNSFEASISNVISGRQHSCGCAKGKLLIKSKGTHGESKTRLYRIYSHIIERCNNPNCREYQWYGARGIKCEFESYESFRNCAIKNGYRDDLTCERINVNGNYSPENITFIPLRLQARNTRSNVLITYNGLTLCAAEWAGIIGVKSDTITKRKRSGWDDNRIIETPVNESVDMKLIPTEIIGAIRAVRLFGLKKYGDPDNWKKVEIQRYRDAAFRHFMAYLDDPDGTDAESGLSHLAHLACNIAFLCELEKNA